GSHADTIAALAFSPDGRWLASAGWDRVVKVWEVATGREAMTLTTERSGFDYVTFSPDGRTLAASSAGDIMLWDGETGRLLRTLAGSTALVGGLTFNRDGRTLVSAGGDGAARVWDPATGELLATLYSFADDPDWLVVTPDGLFDGSPGGWRAIWWRF